MIEQLSNAKLQLILFILAWISVLYSNDTLMQKLSIVDQTKTGSGIGVTIAITGVLSYRRIFRVISVSHPTPAPTNNVNSFPEPVYYFSIQRAFYFFTVAVNNSTYSLKQSFNFYINYSVK